MQNPDPSSGQTRDGSSTAPACSESKKPSLSLSGSSLSMDWQGYRTELDGHPRLTDKEVREKIQSGEFVKLPETPGISLTIGQGIRLELTKKYLFIYEPQTEGEARFRKPLSALKQLPASVRQALKNSPDGTYVMNVGREYCTKELRTLLIQLGKDYQEKGKSVGEDWKLEVSSGFRSADYQSVLRMVNGNASPNSAHLTGSAVDISYKNMTADQKAWLQSELLKREKAGTIEATKESNKQCYHFVAFSGPCTLEVETGAPATPEQISQKEKKKDSEQSTGGWWASKWASAKEYFSRYRLYGPQPPVLEPEKGGKRGDKSTLVIEPRLESRIQFWDNVFSKYTKNTTIFMDAAHPWVTFDIRAYDPKKPYVKLADKQIRTRMISSVLSDFGDGKAPTFGAIEKDLRKQHAAVQSGEIKEFEKDLRREKKGKPRPVAAKIDKTRRAEFGSLLREENEIFERSLAHHKESFGEITNRVKQQMIL